MKECTDLRLHEPKNELQIIQMLSNNSFQRRRPNKTFTIPTVADSKPHGKWIMSWHCQRKLTLHSQEPEEQSHSVQFSMVVW